MGANTSRSELNSFQKSVTDISKGVKSDASTCLFNCFSVFDSCTS